ncbi:MAG: sulfotransferase family protein [Anaerolineales bacterium]
MPLLLLTGHQRSGTTILRILLNSHPDISITNEFNNLQRVGADRLRYSRHILKRLWHLRERRDNFSSGTDRPSRWWENAWYIFRYLMRIHLSASWRIGYPEAETAMRSLYPGHRWVGDKYPDYIWDLDQHSAARDLTCIVIFRDGRDVVSSALEKARTTWKNKRYARHFDTPEKSATRWVKAIQIMEQCSGGIFSIRYERLVKEPETTARELGDLLGVDPAGFPLKRILDTNIGKHRSLLTAEELAIVERIAGPTLSRLGYT